MSWKKIISPHKIRDNKVVWINVFYVKHEHLAFHLQIWTKVWQFAFFMML